MYLVQISNSSRSFSTQNLTNFCICAAVSLSVTMLKILNLMRYKSYVVSIDTLEDSKKLAVFSHNHLRRRRLVRTSLTLFGNSTGNHCQPRSLSRVWRPFSLGWHPWLEERRGYGVWQRGVILIFHRLLYFHLRSSYLLLSASLEVMIVKDVQ